MELFGRELSLEQMIGLVECHATPDEDLVHRAALEIVAALRESRRRAEAAEDFIQYLDRNYSRYLPENEQFEQWRGPQAEEGE